MIQAQQITEDDLRKLIARGKTIADLTLAPTEYDENIDKELDELLFGELAKKR